MPSAVDYSDSDDDSGPPVPLPAPAHSSTREHAKEHDMASSPRPGPRVKLTIRPAASGSMAEARSTQPSSQPPPPPPSSSIDADHSPAPIPTPAHASVPRPNPNPRGASPSPVPLVTLRLAGRPAAVPRTASYSDSSDDQDDASAARPLKKLRLAPASNPLSPRKSASQALHAPGATAPGGPAPLGTLHAPTKSYDWLPPSSLGTSHHGPPDRASQSSTPVPTGSGGEGATLASASATPVLGPYIGEGSPVLGSVDGDAKGKRASLATSLKKKDSVPGKGKAWRKGLKKGMAVPWKDDFGSTFGSPGDITPLSLDGSPEPGHPGLDPTFSSTATGGGGGDSSIPFVEADPVKLGFPVFSKPIVPPKINLSPFPKVTQFFAPINGGDPGKFPRKEKTRSWQHSERGIVGIGGGTLNFKSWTKAPGGPSELGRLIQADKEARSLANQRSKAAAAAASASASASASAAAAPDATAVVKAAAKAMASIPAWDRPYFPHAVSSDSTATLSNTGGGGGGGVSSAVYGAASALLGLQDGGDGASDIGDGEESVVSTSAREGMTPPPLPPPLSTGASTPAGGATTPTPGGPGGGARRGAKAKAKPRKSKLAQEIHIEPADNGTSTSAIEDIM